MKHTRERGIHLEGEARNREGLLRSITEKWRILIPLIAAGTTVMSVDRNSSEDSPVVIDTLPQIESFEPYVGPGEETEVIAALEAVIEGVSEQQRRHSPENNSVESNVASPVTFEAELLTLSYQQQGDYLQSLLNRGLGDHNTVDLESIAGWGSVGFEEDDDISSHTVRREGNVDQDIDMTLTVHNDEHFETPIIITTGIHLFPGDRRTVISDTEDSLVNNIREEYEVKDLFEAWSIIHNGDQVDIEERIHSFLSYAESNGHEDWVGSARQYYDSEDYIVDHGNTTYFTNQNN